MHSPRVLRSRINIKTVVTGSIDDPFTPPKQIKGSENGMITPPQTLEKVKKRLFSDLDDFTTEEQNNLSTPIRNVKLQRQEVKPPVTPCPSPEKLVFGKDSVYSRTKSLLQRSAGIFTQDASGCLPTRKTQFNEIVDFLDDNMTQMTSSSLYITGPPGTGKTAQLNSIIQNKFLPIIPTEESSTSNDSHNNNEDIKFPNLRNQSLYKLKNDEVRRVAAIHINCIALSGPSMIFSQIFEAFNNIPFDDDETSSPKKDDDNRNDNEVRYVRNMEQLKNYMESFNKKVTFVVVLDEMDKLLYNSSNDNIATKIIFELFLLARLPSINFLLVGIANSLDLKDRFLSRLNLRQDLLPKTIVFHPYSSEEMFNIVMNRINTVNDADGCIFNPIAIKFATKKCSGSTGDIRKLFDVLRNSIEIVELEVIRSLRQSSPIKNGNFSNTFNLIKVGMPHVAKVFAQLNNNISTRSRIGKLNMQQRIILCALVDRENMDIFQSQCSLDDSYDYYKKFVQSRDSVTKPLNRNEFLEIANALQTCGVVAITQGRSSGKTRHTVNLIKTSVDKNEFQEEISKIDILKRFI